MTIRPGGQWGRLVERPHDLVAVTRDADAIGVIASRGKALLAGGDLARTVGGDSSGDRNEVLEIPIDLIDVSIDGVEHTACAHVIVRNRATRGGWWRGGVIAVMNAEFVGEWDVAPRGHPNDGRVEIVETAGAIGLRDRLAIRQRLALGTHVPHPSLATRSVRDATWELERASVVVVDGRHCGGARSVEIRVRPDAAVVYV